MKHESLTIASKEATVELLPGLGAAMARFDALVDGRPVPLLRPLAAGSDPHPFDTGCILLAPWANRISGGGFCYAGIRTELAPNVAGQALPIHGNAMLEPWQVVSSTGASAQLRLRSPGPGVFDYQADVEYALAGASLRVGLALTHCGKRPAPYGLGFHPWFVRTAQTLLQAAARTVWLMDDRQLPSACVPVADRPDWDFRRPGQLPATLIDNPFSGWDGQARIIWEDRGLALDIAAGGMDVCHVFSPGLDSGFICFEPVSHLVDEHNQASGTDFDRLAVLHEGQSLEASMTLGWQRC